MARMVSEGVRLPDDLDPYPDQNFPGHLLAPFMGKWQLHHMAVDNFTGFYAAAKAETGIDMIPIPGSASTYRPFKQQEALFFSRYAPGPGPGKLKKYKGQTYHLKAGMAMAAVPGGSIHGWGLAVDAMKTNGKALSWAEVDKMRGIAERFAIAWTVSSEPWHQSCLNAQGVAGVPVSSPAPAPATPRAHSRLGDKSWDVVQGEVWLRDRAGQKEIGEPTGVFDERVAAAVRNVQNWFRLPVTGELDPATWALLEGLPQL